MNIIALCLSMFVEVNKEPNKNGLGAGFGPRAAIWKACLRCWTWARSLKILCAEHGPDLLRSYMLNMGQIFEDLTCWTWAISLKIFHAEHGPDLWKSYMLNMGQIFEDMWVIYFKNCFADAFLKGWDMRMRVLPSKFFRQLTWQMSLGCNKSLFPFYFALRKVYTDKLVFILGNYRPS